MSQYRGYYTTSTSPPPPSQTPWSSDTSQVGPWPPTPGLSPSPFSFVRDDDFEYDSPGTCLSYSHSDSLKRSHYHQSESVSKRLRPEVAVAEDTPDTDTVRPPPASIHPELAVPVFQTVEVGTRWAEAGQRERQTDWAWSSGRKWDLPAQRGTNNRLNTYSAPPRPEMVNTAPPVKGGFGQKVFYFWMILMMDVCCSSDAPEDGMERGTGAWQGQTRHGGHH